MTSLECWYYVLFKFYKSLFALLSLYSYSSWALTATLPYQLIHYYGILMVPCTFVLVFLAELIWYEIIEICMSQLLKYLHYLGVIRSRGMTLGNTLRKMSKVLFQGSIITRLLKLSSTKHIDTLYTPMLLFYYTCPIQLHITQFHCTISCIIVVT